MVINLNGHDIYRHATRPDANRMFGLFHYTSQTAAQVRNIMLQGTWPRELTTDQMANPLDRLHTDESAVDVQAREALIDPSWLQLRDQAKFEQDNARQVE
jgi:hypothetical protein